MIFTDGKVLVIRCSSDASLAAESNTRSIRLSSPCICSKSCAVAMSIITMDSNAASCCPVIVLTSFTGATLASIARLSPIDRLKRAAVDSLRMIAPGSKSLSAIRLPAVVGAASSGPALSATPSLTLFSPLENVALRNKLSAKRSTPSTCSVSPAITTVPSTTGAMLRTPSSTRRRV